MIQLIFGYKDEAVLKEVLEGRNLPIIKVPEMLEDIYLTLIKAEGVTELEYTLKQPSLKMEFVGSYNMDGSQYIWTEPAEIQRNHSINKYKNKLKNYIVYDDELEIIEDRPYTIEEAKNIQVNKIYGYNDRILD